MVEVRRLIGHNELSAEEIRLMAMGLQSIPGISVGGALAEMLTMLRQHYLPLGVFMAYDGDGKPKAWVAGMLPESQMFPFPAVYHIYNEGEARHLNAITVAVVDWFKEHGYNAFVATNVALGKDEAFKRLFRQAGEAKSLGTTFQFDIPEGETVGA